MTHKHATTFTIGGTEVELKVEFDFVPAQPAMPPSFSSGGEPAVPAEVDVTSMEWLSQPTPGSINPAVWHEIERGPLFDLIAMDLYDELVDVIIDREQPE
jgi:hypothetical protein